MGRALSRAVDEKPKWLDFYEDRLESEVPKIPGQAGKDVGVQTDHSGNSRANVEGLYGQKMGPHHASVDGSKQDPRARVCPKDRRLQRVEGGVAQDPSSGQVERQLWEQERQVEMKRPEIWARDQEGVRLQTAVVRRCYPSYRSGKIGEKGMPGLNEDQVATVSSCRLGESVLRGSERDSTCYW